MRTATSEDRTAPHREKEGEKKMTHRIFYGTDFKLTDSDKKMFSREGYECKD